MISILALSTLVAGTSALVARGSSCCFQLTATGGPGGQVGQLSDGQNRIGQGLPPATYCIDNGAITDGNGRGCILTPPTTQFQCDTGATPTGGFGVGCDGTLTYNGNSTFYACPTGDNGGYNIYTTPAPGQTKCVPITLSSGGTCGSGCPPPPAPKCPLELTGAWEYPHLIVPVDKSKPDTAMGTSYNGAVSSTVSSLFNFDIPSSDAGKTCTLAFSLPRQEQLQTSSFTLTGTGAIDFASLKNPASQSTTWNNAPEVVSDFGVKTVVPGNSYTIASFSCSAGQAIGFKMSSADGTALNYFQDYNPCPIGLYILAA